MPSSEIKCVEKVGIDVVRDAYYEKKLNCEQHKFPSQEGGIGEKHGTCPKWWLRCFLSRFKQVVLANKTPLLMSPFQIGFLWQRMVPLHTSYRSWLYWEGVCVTWPSGITSFTVLHRLLRSHLNHVLRYNGRGILFPLQIRAKRLLPPPPPTGAGTT